jgi:hypothetical protein
MRCLARGRCATAEGLARDRATAEGLARGRRASEEGLARGRATEGAPARDKIASFTGVPHLFPTENPLSQNDRTKPTLDIWGAACPAVQQSPPD